MDTLEQTEVTQPYATADELIADVPEAEHDLEIGRLRIRVRIPVTYSEVWDFDQKAAEWVKLVKSMNCPKELAPLMKKKDFELAAIFTLTENCVIPKLDALKAAKMLGDGIKVKAIIRSMEALRTVHLQTRAVEAIEAGKGE